MAYTIDKNLEAGMKMLADGKKIDAGLKLINKSARKGTTKGKSFFEVGRIIREGVPGLEAKPEESRRYYDAAVSQFFKENRDSMDNRELGDYFNYGLGTEPVNLEKALEYYDLSASQGDDEAAAKAAEIRKSVDSKKAVTVVEDVKPVETNTAVSEATPVAAAAVVAGVSNVPSQASAVTETSKVATIETVPAVAPVSEPVQDETVKIQLDTDSLLIKAIRLIDDPSSTLKDRADGIELAKAACDEGSLRAAVLLGFLYEGNSSLVAKDYLVSKKYYELAVSRGSASAEFRLGRLYMNSVSGFADEEKGHQLIIDSAHKGYSYALNYLGDCFREKVSDSKNLEVSYRYYALAGERGLGLAYHNMAEIDASRQQLELSKKHETYAAERGYLPEEGIQDPLFNSVHN
ncbi:MAG: hypothetical protein WCR67_07380 [Bacilli bacterium]